ncbi:MAG TPA: hypothetical protein VGP93_03945 [Polyangiaceae bacterium]|nr:hypothetical protein [Polyangiaceae bacterium]
MRSPPNAELERQRRVGLCATCRHARVVRSSKNSEFWLCQRSQLEPEYAKYPRLPVVRCAGHEKED